MNFKLIHVSKIFLILFLIFQSCYAPPNLVDVKKEIINYYENGGFDSEMESVVERAESQLSGIDFNDSSTVVFDVDETALSNYEVMKKSDFCYDKEVWDNWIDDIKASSVPHMLSLYDFLLDKKVKIVFITGRKNYQQEATEINLRAEGFISFDTLITRAPDEYKMTAVEFKSEKRKDLTEKGYKIEALIGDQNSDLEGSFIGVVQIKIPNYIYKIE